MLIYHPAFDVYHCLFRMLSLTAQGPELEKDRVRILEFVLCFPSVAGQFRLPPKMAAVRRTAEQAGSAYRTPINPKAVFIAMEPAQDGAMACLASAGYFSAEGLSAGIVRRTQLPLPDDLHARSLAFQERERIFFQRLLPALMEFPLYGPDGLKHRSGLLEFRYDPA